jgi:transmembrane 9 superfamily member 1
MTHDTHHTHPCLRRQIFTLSLCIFGLALLGTFYPYNRGALFTALIVLYACTAGIAGYTAARLYRQMEGQAWGRAVLVTVLCYCGPFFAMFCFLNTVAIAYRVRLS